MWPMIARMLFGALRGAMSAAGKMATSVAPATIEVARYGRLAFIGLVNNRPLLSLGQQEIRNAFAKVGLHEAHNSHFISRLIERGPHFGINSLNDFARALNSGTARAGSSMGTVDIILPGGRAAVVINEAGELITFLPL